MITSDAFRGKRYAELGLARSGAPVVQALLASGVTVTAWDADEERRNALLPGTGRGTGEAGGGGSPLDTPSDPAAPLHQPASGPLPRSGEDLAFADPLSIDLAGYDGVVVSPACR